MDRLLALFLHELDLEEQVDRVAGEGPTSTNPEFRALYLSHPREAHPRTTDRKTGAVAVELDIQRHRLGDAVHGEVARELAMALGVGGHTRRGELDRRELVGLEVARDRLVEHVVGGV